jgi:hypothetical protein
MTIVNEIWYHVHWFWLLRKLYAFYFLRYLFLIHHSYSLRYCSVSINIYIVIIKGNNQNAPLEQAIKAINALVATFHWFRHWPFYLEQWECVIRFIFINSYSLGVFHTYILTIMWHFNNNVTPYVAETVI